MPVHVRERRSMHDGGQWYLCAGCTLSRHRSKTDSGWPSKPRKPRPGVPHQPRSAASPSAEMTAGRLPAANGVRPRPVWPVVQKPEPHCVVATRPACDTLWGTLYGTAGGLCLISAVVSMSASPVDSNRWHSTSGVFRAPTKLETETCSYLRAATSPPGALRDLQQSSLPLLSPSKLASMAHVIVGACRRHRHRVAKWDRICSVRASCAYAATSSAGSATTIRGTARHRCRGSRART